EVRWSSALPTCRLCSWQRPPAPSLGLHVPLGRSRPFGAFLSGPAVVARPAAPPPCRRPPSAPLAVQLARHHPPALESWSSRRAVLPPDALAGGPAIRPGRR